MFGLNDTGAQPTNGGNDEGSNLASPLVQPNPFVDTPVTTPAPLPAITPEPIITTTHQDTGQPPIPEPSQKPDDLLDLKEHALNSLQPLVGHLDQTPEEKFKTTMMLIQATDNSALVKEAYEAANQITDEKARAQALLDVVNEINYFTQHNGDAEDKPQQA